jgi:peptidoglycan/LPS O-acetylase OafA/YrhL
VRRLRASPSGTPHVAALDAVRAIAAMSVVAYHAWLYSLPKVSAGHRDGLDDLVWHELRLGLVLFFVLSGFLLYGPWVRAARERKDGPQLGAYALRRAARIVPAYWLALVGSVLLLWPHDAVPGVRLPDANDLWLFAVFGQNFSEGTLLKLDPPMWTLAVEVSFYATLPLLGWLALRGGRRAGAIAAPLAFGVSGVLYNLALSDDRGLPMTASKILPAVAPYFALGMLAAVAVQHRSLRRGGVLALAGLGAVLVLGDGYWAADAATRGSHDVALRIWRDVPAAAGFALLLVAVAAPARVPRLLSARPLAWLGTVSYGIYLWHVPVMLFLRAHGLLPLTPVGALATVIVPTLALAAASWYLVEQPAQAWARSVIARRRGAAAGSVSDAGARRASA